MNTNSKIVCIVHVINHKRILYKFLNYINKEFFEITKFIYITIFF